MSSTAPQKTVLVSGEAAESVQVQSQLATSKVDGDVITKSNLDQVIAGLSKHDTSSKWLEAENKKVEAWGQAEMQKVLSQTKAMEEALVAGAKEKQKTLDASHSAEIAKLVKEMDLRKAALLKELEDGLQRQIQASLTESKKEINLVESEMNARKMELLKQSQIKSSKEIDALSNLVVETKLVPSQTRTVIETNTETGNVLAVAAGGNITTGEVKAQSISTQRIAAIPNAGELRQATEVVQGDMVRDSDGRKVGEGAIVNTMTDVHAQAGQRGGDVTVRARPLGAQQPIAGAQQPIAGAHTATQERVIHDAAAHGTRGLHHVEKPHDGVSQDVKQAYLAEHGGQHMQQQQQHMAGGEHHGDHKEHGLLCKVKHALGMSGEKDAHHEAGGEPRSMDAHKRVY